MQTLAVHSSKHSIKVVMFLNLSIETLSTYCSKSYAKRIVTSSHNGSLWGAYFTKSGFLRATFI